MTIMTISNVRRVSSRMFTKSPFVLKRDGFRLNYHRAIAFCLRKILPENRCPLYANAALRVGIMRQDQHVGVGADMQAKSDVRQRWVALMVSDRSPGCQKQGGASPKSLPRNSSNFQPTAVGKFDCMTALASRTQLAIYFSTRTTCSKAELLAGTP